jgi:hypothetical protein
MRNQGADQDPNPDPNLNPNPDLHRDLGPALKQNQQNQEVSAIVICNILCNENAKIIFNWLFFFTIGKSQSHKTKTVKMSKKKMMKLMKKQDKEIGNCLRNMMKNGLKSINQYRYSSDKNMRILAEKYQQALDPLMV